MTTLLQQAIELAKSGNRDEAETLIRQSLAENPNNEVAWIWLSGVTRDVLVKREALSRALALNPDNDLAKQGLERFGAPDEAPEIPKPPTETAQVNINIGKLSVINNTDETSGADVFPDMPEDFDFNFDMDESPVFDVDLNALGQSSDTPIEDNPTENLFDFDESPAFIDDGNSAPNSENIADKLEDLFAHSEPDGGFDDALADDSALPEEETPIILTEPETGDLVIESTDEPKNDIHDLLRSRQQRQNRLLLTAAAFFAILVIGSCSLYYYFTEKVDYYLLMPQLAGSELTVKARGIKNGTSLLDFNGFPASSATIQWTLDTKASTCKGGNGLSIDFGNGDTPSLFSNNACKDDQCTFEKDISPAPISQVTVNYRCGKDAVITLHK